MKRDTEIQRKRSVTDTASVQTPARRGRPGGRSSVQRRYGTAARGGASSSVQKRYGSAGSKSGEDAEATRGRAAAGVAGAGSELPFAEQIQASFGQHDLSGVSAHVGGDAAEACGDIDASAYATGSDIAFAKSPDLHTAAHEAAHVVQQAGGVQLKGGVGESGDAYEQHADRVADRVVSGQSAESLLSEVAGPGATPGVQRQDPEPSTASDAAQSTPAADGSDAMCVASEITEARVQSKLAEHAARFSSQCPTPEVCDRIAREVLSWIDVLGQRIILRSIHAAGFLDPWLRGMSPEMQQRMASSLNVTATAASVSPEDRISGQPNEARARTALGMIRNIQSNEDADGKRITDGVVDILVRAVAEPRTEDPNGQEGILGIHQAVQACRTLLVMNLADYTSVVARLAMSGGSEGGTVQVQNALIIKAVAARHDEYAARARNEAPAAGSEDPDQAMAGFADSISGMSDEDVIKQTSLIDLDASDGELGTRQRFTMSCAPTTAIMARGEVDPIYAMRLRQNSDVSDNQQAHDPMADEQRRLLEQYGQSSPGQPGQARALVVETQLPILRQRVVALAAGATLPQRTGMVQLIRQATGQPFNAALAAIGLAHVRAAHGGFPDADLLVDMRQYAQRTDVGLTDPETQALMGDHLGDANETSVATDTSIGGPRTTKQLLDSAAVALDQGLDVPFGVSWQGGGGHVMLMTNVRDNGANAHDFLISDPATGTTAWVTEPNILAMNLAALALGNGIIDATWIQTPDVAMP